MKKCIEFNIFIWMEPNARTVYYYRSSIVDVYTIQLGIHFIYHSN